MKIYKLLIIEDEESTLFGYSRYLTNKGFSVSTATNLNDAKQKLAAECFDAILVDLRLPDGSSLDLIKDIKATEDGTAVIVISGTSDIPTAVSAMKCGAHNFLTKPVDMENLEVVIKNSLEVEALRKRDTRNKRLAPSSPNTYFGSSAEIDKLKQYAEVAAMNDTVVLLLGETGTGKGVLARWIHEHSQRREGTFVELNCSSLRGELLRSELYGHTRGAFTSAIKDREGLIEVADSGTLFLDEIGDMDAEVQAELLKTIEERTFRRIGENRVRTSNFRLICATNRILTGKDKDTTFRSDLYYRISVFPIELPPLRKRKDDILGLLKHILVSYGYEQFPLDPKLLTMLLNYSWPGNIREMRNTVERGLLLAQGAPLNLDHFPGLGQNTIPENIRDEEDELWDLDEIEKKHIVQAIRFFEGDKVETSKALGISLSSLYRKLETIDFPVSA